MRIAAGISERAAAAPDGAAVGAAQNAALRFPLRVVLRRYAARSPCLSPYSLRQQLPQLLQTAALQTGYLHL